jgi:predicted nucleic acid-binding protein
MPGLHAGEAAAINLALALRADVLLIDDQAGRQAALARHLRTVRTAALLLDAALAGVLPDLREAYRRLAATNFRVSRQTLALLLERFEKERGKLR